MSLFYSAKYILKYFLNFIAYNQNIFSKPFYIKNYFLKAGCKDRSEMIVAKSFF